MLTEKKLTGYPHIDKPWLKYHSQESACRIDLNGTIYNNFLKTAMRKSEDLALIDFKSGIKLTYAELLKQADAFANALSAMGIGRDNKVGVLGFHCLVDPVALLGANKLGATTVFINPDGGPSDIAQNVQYVDILILENVFTEMEPAINHKQIPVVIFGDYPYFPSPHCMGYDDFIKAGRAQTVDNILPQEDRAALVIFSSGSTGTAKPIVHTNRTVNAAIQKMLSSDFPINENNILIKAIPSHIGLGVITTMLVSLIAGATFVQLKGLPDPAVGLAEETFGLIAHHKEWMTKNDIQNKEGLILFAAPYFAKYILARIDELKDMSMIKGILLGGAKMQKEELDMMDKAFAEKGLNIPICNGYGQNEMGGAVTLNTVHHNKNGSAGYPVYGTTIRIVDRYTKVDLPYNTVGQILEQSESKFMCYMGMPEKTAASKVILPDGTQWYDSTDLGYMDEDGFLYITGRTTRVVIKTDHKISMDVIEEKIKGLDCIRDAAVVPLCAEGDVVAFVECNDVSIRVEALMERLKSEKSGLSIFEIPASVEIGTELPRMNNGKVDYVKLGEIVKQSSNNNTQS